MQLNYDLGRRPQWKRTTSAHAVTNSPSLSLNLDGFSLPPPLDSNTCSQPSHGGHGKEFLGILQSMKQPGTQTLKPGPQQQRD